MVGGEHAKADEHSLTLEVRAVGCRLPLRGFNITVETEPVLGTKGGKKRTDCGETVYYTRTLLFPGHPWPQFTWLSIEPNIFWNNTGCLHCNSGK